MTLLRRVAKQLIPKPILLRLTSRNRRRQATAGIPEGLSFKRLDELCRNVNHTAVREVYHIHLSGWKRAGAFRLLVQTNGGKEWHLVYKNAVYSQNHIPALKDFPVLPGPPECLIYNIRQGPLAEFLPVVYWSQEVQPNKIYRYILEDLGDEHYHPGLSSNRNQDLLRIAERLPSLQRALKESLEEKDAKHILRFDRTYYSALASYVYDSLSSYLHEIPDPAVRRIMDLWPQLMTLYQSNEFYVNRPQGPIHGDFNRSNLYIHVKDNTRIKVVDWEWTGLGILYADLVSLMKDCDMRIQEKALKRFGSQLEGLSMSDHWKWYHWCQLERSLLDAGFLARQQVESQHRVEWIRNRIHKSTHLAFDIYQELH